MKTRRNNIHSGSHGAALILILSLVVILTLLVALILTRATTSRQISSSSAGQQKADQLAQGALQEILNDCRQEIAAGSRPFAGNSNSYNPQNVYIPTTNLTIVPAFAGYYPSAGNDPFPNLLKRSTYNAQFFPSTNAALYDASDFPPSNLASQLNSGSASSIDGRSITAARWNKALLMDTNEVATNFTAPDWTLVTRAGPKPFAAWSSTLKDNSNSTNYVVGRYAYMIYDEGGLLDANTAGCNSNTASGNAIGLATDFDKSSKRGRLGQADLTAIPGLTQADVDKIVQWRNARTANATNAAMSYFDYLFHGGFSTNTFQYNTNDPSAAFTTTQNGDQTFTTRQDLLDFFNFTWPGGTEAQALPYLGTFSRELNAPSYCPPNPVATSSNTISVASVASQYQYANNAESATSVNRNFPSVKFANGGMLLDGSGTVNAGDPLVRRRFPLSRIQLIQQKIANPNSTTNDALIHDYFGLVYSSATGKWTYTSPDSPSTVASSIKTLAQVAQVNPPREPDFFELLQAGILNGSLGKTAGTDLNKDASFPNGHSTSGSDTVDYDSRTDFQVIQIGANIIDQYGADPAPTTVTYGGTPSGNQPSDFYDFYGIGNLPYISKINQVIFRAKVPAGLNDPNGYGNPQLNQPWYYPNVSAWLQFELWNPHQNPEAGPALPLRVYAVGTATVVAFSSNSSNGGNAWSLWPGCTFQTEAYAYGQNTFTSAETITIPSSAYLTADNFREPQVLTSNLGVTVSVSADHLHEANDYSSGSGWDFIGLKTGDAFAPSYTAEHGGYYSPATPTGAPMNPTDAGVISGAGGITFYLQCEYPAGSGNWRTIQRVKNCIVTPDTGTVLPSCWLKCLSGIDNDWEVPSHSLTSVQSASATTRPKSAYRMLPDPRTDRFGVFEGFREDTASTDLVGPSFNETVLPSVFGNATRGLLGYDWDTGRMRVPTTWNYLAAYQGYKSFVKQYTSNGWYDDMILNYQTWQTYPGGVWAGLLNINAKNIPTAIKTGGNQLTNFSFYNYYYADNDGIIRGGDGYYADGNDHDANGFTDGFSAQMKSSAGTDTGIDHPERPLILKRPFRTVGELGYVHRGEPWKSLDFFTKDSADAGLLDLFSIDEEDVVAGTVDLNTRQAPVIQAILQGETKNELAASAAATGDPIISTSDATALANLLVTERFGTTSATGPLANRSELVTRFLGQNSASTSYTAFPLNKTRREAVVRPLAAVGNTRTWNLLIDIIAQSGRYPASATGLTQFQIEGEKRYWWHLSIDRFTGQIVASQLEPVYE